MSTPLTRRERIALGQSRRKHTHRTDLAGWQPKFRRADPLQLLCRCHARTRTRASLHQGRPHGRLALRLFARSGPHYGMRSLPGPQYRHPHPALRRRACAQPGAFAAPDGRLVFDINDFDETIRGPFEWDVKRMATSLILAGSEVGAKSGMCLDATYAFLKSYRTAMHNFAQMPSSSWRAIWRAPPAKVKPISQIIASLNERHRCTILRPLRLTKQIALSHLQVAPPILLAFKAIRHAWS